jgi:hypothetical protein
MIDEPGRAWQGLAGPRFLPGHPCATTSLASLPKEILMSNVDVRRCKEHLEAFVDAVTPTPAQEWVKSVMEVSSKRLDSKDKAVLLAWAKDQAKSIAPATTVFQTTAVNSNNRRRAMLEEVIKVLQG